MVYVGMLRQSITDLPDKDGYLVLMAKVEELQNQLRQVKVKDAEGNILLDADGNECNHAMTDAEHICRNWVQTVILLFTD
jgi:hypothetical protein